MATFFSPKDESTPPLCSSLLKDGSDFESTSTRRAQVIPPSPFTEAQPLWKRWRVALWAWLWDRDPPRDGSGSSLHTIRAEFVAALWDLQSLRANQVRDQVEATRSLRDLWHLRADVFKAIATHRGQIEAQLRLDALDSHFPIRASRHPDENRSAKVTSW